jgi:hypothetical protein
MARFSIVAEWPRTVILVLGRASPVSCGGEASRRLNRPVAVPSRRRRFFWSVLNSGSANGGARKTSTVSMGFTTGWSPVL